ncbi:hypothetical protein AALO_G00280230 [Alosa alosa]|uniref:Uncharacterized protein n=1 Tax=Alosa alosa TaxID=278164 RepID=A0AAV6FP88_9TELE|nr:hypothetical protein AALO_G00280230 [Alosa alosa]
MEWDQVLPLLEAEKGQRDVPQNWLRDDLALAISIPREPCSFFLTSASTVWMRGTCNAPGCLSLKSMWHINKMVGLFLRYIGIGTAAQSGADVLQYVNAVLQCLIHLQSLCTQLLLQEAVWSIKVEALLLR